jgi:hypothetical protein
VVRPPRAIEGTGWQKGVLNILGKKRNYFQRSTNLKSFIHIIENATSGCALLGAFPKLAKVAISFVMPVCPSLRSHEQLGSRSTDFHGILYLSIFRKPLEKIQVPLKSF